MTDQHLVVFLGAGASAGICPARHVPDSDLWNVKTTVERYDPTFLDVFEDLAARTRPLE